MKDLSIYLQIIVSTMKLQMKQSFARPMFRFCLICNPIVNTIFLYEMLYMNLIEIPLVFICGFTFPTEILPVWAQRISNVLAPTWAVRMLRMSCQACERPTDIHLGTGIIDMSLYTQYLGILVIELLILVLFTIGLYHWMDKRVRIRATLEVS